MSGAGVPDAAVAAAKKVFGGKPPRGMRAAIAAAAPFIAAQAWEEGYEYHAGLAPAGWTGNPYKQHEDDK